MSEGFLYRHFAEDGKLLYVGESLNALSRLSQHRDSPWFDQISLVKIEKFDSKESARKAERIAIRSEKPKYNKQVPRAYAKVVRAPEKIDFKSVASIEPPEEGWNAWGGATFFALRDITKVLNVSAKTVWFAVQAGELMAPTGEDWDGKKIWNAEKFAQFIAEKNAA